MSDSNLLWPAYEARGWRRCAHLQTIYSGTRLASIASPFTRERLELDDGDFLDLDWLRAAPDKIAILVHGLGGSSQSTYILRCAAELYAHGYSVCAMNFRGCSGEANRLEQSYHSGKYDDLARVVDSIVAANTQVQIGIVGFSLGGNVLLRWLAEKPQVAQLLAAISISAPVDLKASLRQLDRGFSRVYKHWLLRALVRATIAKWRDRKGPIDLIALRSVNTFEQFDELITAPLHGFKNAQHYYDWASSRTRLNQIEVPTWFVHARDDPFIHRAGIPHSTELSVHIHECVSEHGGHVGFLEPAPLGGRWRPSYERNICAVMLNRLGDPRR